MQEEKIDFKKLRRDEQLVGIRVGSMMNSIKENLNNISIRIDRLENDFKKRFDKLEKLFIEDGKKMQKL